MDRDPPHRDSEQDEVYEDLYIGVDRQGQDDKYADEQHDDDSDDSQGSSPLFGVGF